MKKSLAVVLVLAVAVLAACGKNRANPGAEVDPNRGTQAGTVPGGAARVEAALLVGVWATDCVKEEFRTNPQPHITQLYFAKRTYITIDATKMTQKLLRFVGQDCTSGTVGPLESTPADVWTYRVDTAGAIDAAPWAITYLSVNGDTNATFTGEARITREDEPFAQETIRFEGPLVYRRQP